MPKVQIKLKRPTGESFKGWTFVIIAGLVLAAFAVVESGRLAPVPVVPAADGSSQCQHRVTVPVGTEGGRELNVRVAPDLSAEVRGTLDDGEVVDTTAAIANGFRQLEGGLWVSQAGLVYVAGENCG